MKARLQKGRQPHFRRLVLATALTGVMAGASGIAIAQASPATDSGKDKNAATDATAPVALEEIIVTAQKRKEPLQKTPIAMTAFSTRELENNRVNNVLDLMNKVPSLNLVPFTGNKAAPNLFIRGMGGLNTQTTKDNAVGVYIDGVLVGRGTGMAADIADLERVEVLRGPQGTLYGRNTTAGAINFITVKPDRDLAFEQQVTSGSYNLFESRTKLNVPLTENLFTRISYMRSSNSGWVKNNNNTLPDQINFNKDDKEALKWAVRLKASDNFTVDYSLDQSHMTYGNLFYQVIQGATALPDRTTEFATVKGLSPSDVKVGGHNLTLTWDLDGTVLKSITSYRKLDSKVNMDYVDIFTQYRKEDQDQTSQEFQLVGDALSKRLNYVAGFFYFKENSDEYVISTYNPALSDAWKVKASSRSIALYGQATWTPPILNDRMRLTLGLRDTQDSRDATKTFVGSGFFPAANGMVVPGSKSFSKVNPSLTADYAFTDTVNGYAKISTGYRAGGFNTSSTLAGFANGFGPENVLAKEIGLKSDLLDKRLRVNIAVFDNKYSDLQVDQVRVPAIFTDTLNAGSASVKGVEIETSAVLGKGLTANLFYSYLDAKFNSYIDNGVDLANVKFMPFTPKGQGGLGLQYMTPTPYGRLIFNLDHKWQEAWYSGPNPNTLTAGYGVWNAKAELADIRAVKGSVRVAVWAKNLADKKYRLATTNLGLLSAQFGEPRTVGVNLIYNY